MASTGITTLTPERHVFGAGVWVRNYNKAQTLAAQAANIIGATKGGNEITITREYKDHGSEIDGNKGPIKGLTRITKDFASMKATFAELTVELLLDMLPGATSSESNGVSTITSAAQVGDADYLTNIAWVGDHAQEGDGAVAFIIKNPLSMEPLVMSPAHDEAATLQLAMTAHYDPADMVNAPYEIVFPDDAYVS